MSESDKALAQAIKLTAESNLDLVTELRAGRSVTERMLQELVAIREQNGEILEEVRNAHSRMNESDGKIRVLHETTASHSRQLSAQETRLAAVEAAQRSAGARSASG